MPERAALPDAAARERVRACLDETLFVEAGAGTGKTGALVGRVLALVRTGRAPIEEIAAITFTEAAAAELRERLQRALAEEAAGAEGGWARTALAHLDDAAITTIHGFAHSLLAEHPLEAGLPLRFRVLDEVAGALELERRLGDLAERLAGEPAGAALLGAALAVGLTLRHVEALAARLDECWDRLEGLAVPDLEPLGAEVLAASEQLAASIGEVLAASSGAPGADTLEAVAAEVAAAASRRPPGHDWLDHLEWLCSVPACRAGRRSSGAGGGPLDGLRRAIADLEDERRAVVSRLSGEVLATLARRLAVEARRAAAERCTRGELRFHDLLARAMGLLRSSPAVLERLRRRYRYLLVDEFQDTDPLQLDIVRLLAEDASGTAVPGKLFFVGDPRQSIYRFRGADLDAYLGALAELVPEGPTELVTSFRSVPGVVDFVNAVFGPLLVPDGEAPARFAPLTPVRPALDGGAPVVVLGGAAEGRERADERRAREAADVAEAIVRAVEEGWTVEVAGARRPARFGDVALLVPRRTGLAVFEEALDDAGVPYRVESVSLVYRAQEVRDLLACLRALAYPADASAVVAALRTPLFGCSDDDLLAHRRAGGSWSLDAPRPVGSPERVATALDYLAEAAVRCRLSGVVDTVLALVHERRARQLAVALRHGPEAVRRIDFVVEEARAFAEAGGTGLAELLAWAELRAANNARLVEAPGEQGDAVSIRTVHGAKGLEFPIVVLAELGSAASAQSGPRLVVGGDGRPELRVRAGLETPGFAALAAEEARREEGERRRLAYVGATRARDHLVVALHHAPARSGRPSLAELVASRLEAAPGSWRRLGPRRAPAPGRALGAPGAEPDPPVDEPAYDALLARRAQLAASAGRPTSVAATALVATVPEEAERRAATALGRAVHALLQVVDLRGGDDLAALARRTAAAEGCPELAASVASLASAALASPVLRRAALADVVEREVPVTAVLPEGNLDGVVDLVFVQGGELVAVDYKTDVLAAPGLARAAAAGHRLQAGAYALALGGALGRPVDRFTFVFLAAPGGAVEVEVADLPAACAAARAAAAAALGGRG
ncbi:MAG TPA: UvrD-helicase domain-containing protein [Acidimicrobiales bacterium]|nr:UvrD-helicase domain-containing protein [Acidimicrobiales bacterium]